MLELIKKERIYLWMVIFIFGIHLLGMPHARRESVPAKKSISSMTFNDLGVTEEKVRLFFESKKPSAVFFKYGIFAGLFMLMAGAAMNLVFLFGRKEVIPRDVAVRKPVSWGLADIARVVIIVVFSGYMLGAAGPIILKPLNLGIGDNLRMMLGTFFIDIIAGAAILYFVLVRYGENLSAIGMSSKAFYKNILSGITAYVFILPILVVTLILSMLFLDAIGYKPPPQPVFEMFFEEKRSNVILFFTIFVSILGPVIEEMFFRGFLYSAARKRFGIIVGVLLSSILFSALHTNIVGFLPILILGVLMAFLYEITGSLVASISVHILHNSIIVCLVFFIKELLK